jgi:hypothetical protein
VPSQRVTTDMQSVKDALIDAKTSKSIGGLTRWELCLATGLDYRAVYDRLQRIRRHWQVNDASRIARDGEDLETMLYRALFSAFVSQYAEAKKAMAKARELLTP